MSMLDGLKRLFKWSNHLLWFWW